MADAVRRYTIEVRRPVSDDAHERLFAALVELVSGSAWDPDVPLSVEPWWEVRSDPT